MEWILRKREFVQDKNVLYFSMDFQAFLVCLKQKQCHLLDTIHIVNNTFCSFPIYILPNSGFKIVEMTVVLPGPAAQWAVVTGQHGGTVQSLLRAANQTAARRVSVYRLCNNNTHTHSSEQSSRSPRSSLDFSLHNGSSEQSLHHRLWKLVSFRYFNVTVGEKNPSGI